MNIIWVALGGAAGAVARYGIGNLLKRWLDDAAWGTMTVNLLGSFVIGVLWTASYGKIPEHQKLLIFTGFLGAFTTFSTFKLDAWRHVSDGKYVTAVAYLAMSIVGGLILVFAGCKIGQVISGKKLNEVPVEVTGDRDER